MTSSPSTSEHALAYPEQQSSSSNVTSGAQSNENFLFSDSGLSSLVEISVAVVGDEEGTSIPNTAFSKLKALTADKD